MKLDVIDINAIDDIQKFLPEYDKIHFALAEIKIQPYQFLNWKKADLLLKDVDESRKWVRLTYAEAVWIKLVQKMKDYGLSNDAIRGLRDTIKQDFYFAIGEVLKQNLYQNDGSDKPQNSSLKNEIQELLDVLTKTNNARNEPFNTLFSFLIVDYIVNKTNTCFRILKIGEKWMAYITNDHIYKTLDGEEILVRNNETHLCFALKDCMNDLNFSVFDLELKQIDSVDLMNDSEKKLIHLIREKNFKEIIIKPSNYTQEFRIESKHDGTLNSEDMKRIALYLGYKNYDKISLSKRNEKNAYFEITRKHQ